MTGSKSRVKSSSSSLSHLIRSVINLELKPTATKVLLTLIDYADEEGKAWPSLKTISRVSRVSLRQVAYDLTTLEKQGLIKRIRRAKKSSNISTMIWLLFDHLYTKKIDENPLSMRIPSACDALAPSACDALALVHEMHSIRARGLGVMNINRGSIHCSADQLTHIPDATKSTEEKISSPPYSPNTPYSSSTTETHPILPDGGSSPEKSKTKTKNGTRAEKVLETYGFTDFWTVWPRKVAKKTALKAWLKLKPSEELRGKILKAVETHTASEQWTQDGGRFIPHPATWLNGERWEDELEPSEPEIKHCSGLEHLSREELEKIYGKGDT